MPETDGSVRVEPRTPEELEALYREYFTPPPMMDQSAFLDPSQEVSLFDHGVESYISNSTEARDELHAKLEPGSGRA